MNDLSGKRVLITGASQGLGEAIARSMVAANATVLLTARNEAALIDIKQSLGEAGQRVEIHPADMSSRAACRQMAAKCGDVDVLINNAALTTLSLKPIVEVEDEQWDAAIMLNLLAPKTLMECFCPAMIKRGDGCVINISSIAARVTNPNTAPYSSTKAALEQMTHIAAMEMGPAGVRVNAIEPGIFGTAAMHALLAQAPERRDAILSPIPMQRMGKLEELGQLCVFLASDEAKYINGAVITIDGGRTSGTFVP